MKNNYLISTDLDGTFLGHKNFDYKINEILISKIAQRNIPIIFNTSKTFDEVIAIKKELKNLYALYSRKWFRNFLSY